MKIKIIFILFSFNFIFKSNALWYCYCKYLIINKYISGMGPSAFQNAEGGRRRKAEQNEKRQTEDGSGRAKKSGILRKAEEIPSLIHIYFRFV